MSPFFGGSYTITPFLQSSGTHFSFQQLFMRPVSAPIGLPSGGVCVPLRLTSCLFPVLDSQRTATELFQSLPFRSGTVFRSTSHPRRHFPSSALAWRHTSSNCVIHKTFVVPAKWHCHFGHVNRFTYLLTYLLTSSWKKFDDKCLRLDTIPQCDGRTDGQTDRVDKTISRYSHPLRAWASFTQSA